MIKMSIRKKQFIELSGIRPHRLAMSERGTLNLLAALSIFYAGIEVLAIGGSLLHLSISRSVALIVILLAAGVAIVYRNRLRGEPGPSTGYRSSPGRVAVGFFFLTLLVYLFLWVLAYALPDFSYDGNYYHTPLLHFWARKGYIHWITPGPSPHWGPVATFAWNGYPKVVEAIGYIFLEASGCSRLLNSFNLLLIPLGTLAVTSIALTLGAPSGFALAAGCLFLYLPINLAQSLTAMVDTGSAACYIAFFALLLGTVKRIDTGKIPWGLVVGLGSALGLAVGSKGPGLMLIPAGSLVILVRIIFARRKARKELSSNSAAHSHLRRPLGFVILTIILALGVGGFWAGRNWLITGNPLYPAAISVGGHEIFSGVDLSRQFRPPYRKGTEDWTQTERILSNWVSCLRLDDARNYVYDSRWGGLGFAWLLSIPAIVWLLLTRLKLRRRSPPAPGASYLPDLIFVCLVMFFAMPRNHNHMSRYTIWLAGLGLPCLAATAGRAALPVKKADWRRFFGYAWFGVVSLLAVWEAVISLSIHSSFIERFRGGEDTVPVLSSVFSAARSPYPAGYRWEDFNGSIFEMIMAGDETTAVAIKDKNQRHLIFGHLAQGPALGNREIVFIDHVRAEEEPAYLSCLLRENTVRYVIWDSTIPLRRELVNGSIRQDYNLGKGLWHVFTFAPIEAVTPLL